MSFSQFTPDDYRCIEQEFASLLQVATKRCKDESEVDIVEILCKVIREKFPTFAVRISDNLGRSNPVRYY